VEKGDDEGENRRYHGQSEEVHSHGVGQIVVHDVDIPGKSVGNAT
jgi:hypothetical protein